MIVREGIHDCNQYIFISLHDTPLCWLNVQIVLFSVVPYEWVDGGVTPRFILIFLSPHISSGILLLN